MRTAKRDSTRAPRRRRDLLRSLGNAPVVPHRSASLASIPAAACVTLGSVVRRDPVYAPPTSLLARIGADSSGNCPPPRRKVLVATAVEHPAHDGVDPLLGRRPLRPQRSAANLLHQVLRDVWSLGDIPVAEIPEGSPQPRVDGESCGAEQRPDRSAAPLESQIPPPEEIVDVQEPPQAEGRRPQTCERPCGPVGPGARSLAARTGRMQPVDPACRREIKFEDNYTPFKPESPSERGKPGESKSCPCECVCTRRDVSWAPTPWPERWFRLPRVVLEGIDPALLWLDPFAESPFGVSFPDASVGVASARDSAGRIAVHGSGGSPALDALRGGQSQGLGMSAGLDLDLGVMRPALSLTALTTAGIPGPVAMAPPELPGGGASFIHALRADELSRLDMEPYAPVNR